MPPNDIVEWESYVEGPRWALRDGTILKGVLDIGFEVRDNPVYKAKADTLGPWSLTVVYERRTTSLMRATVFFKVRGKRWCVRVFRSQLEHAIGEYNLAPL